MTATQTVTAAKPATSKPAQAAPSLTAWAAAWCHKGWQVNDAGPQPSNEALTFVAHVMAAAGMRVGCEALHIAMCVDPARQGCTVKQFTNTQAWASPVTAGPVGPANNKRHKLTATATGGKAGLGWFIETPLTGTSEVRGTAYHLHLTDKGIAALKAHGVPASLLNQFSKPPKQVKAAAPKAKGKVKAEKPAIAPTVTAGAVKPVTGTTTAAPQKPATVPAKPVAAVAPVQAPQPVKPAVTVNPVPPKVS